MIFTSTKPPLGSIVNSSHPIVSGMQAYYLMEQVGGKTIKSIYNTKQATNGTLTSRVGSVLANYTHQGIYFDGTDAYVQLNWRVSISRPFTVIFWEKYTTDSSGTYFSTANASTGGAGDLMRSLTTGNIRIFSNGNSADFTANRVAGNIEMFAYTNSAFSGGGAGVQTVYKNGVSLGTAAFSRSGSTNHDITLGIAGNIAGVAFWEGTMIQMMFWDRVLSQAEIRWLYANPYGLLTTYYTPFHLSSFSSGIALKTVNGIARANIKTINGIALANIKTYNGISNV